MITTCQIHVSSTEKTAPGNSPSVLTSRPEADVEEMAAVRICSVDSLLRVLLKLKAGVDQKHVVVSVLLLELEGVNT